MRYTLMVLQTEGEHKGYYSKMHLNSFFELAELYANHMELIERCDYILELDTGNYYTMHDKDLVLDRARILSNYDFVSGKFINGRYVHDMR